MHEPSNGKQRERDMGRRASDEIDSPDCRKRLLEFALSNILAGPIVSAFFSRILDTSQEREERKERNRSDERVPPCLLN